MRRRFIKGLALLLVIAMFAMGLSACATFDAFVKSFVEPEGEPEETVRIGVFEPLTGPDSEKGQLEVMGIELARELYPEILQKKVELVYADNQSDMDIAEVAIKELIEQRPAVVLGSYGDLNSLVAVPYLEEAQIPAIAITNTNPLVTSNNPYYFRVCFVETYQGIALAKFTVEGLEECSPAIIREKGNDAATAMARAYEDKIKQMTGDERAIKMTIEYNKDKEDWSDEIKRLKSNNVKAVFLPADIDMAQRILMEAKAQNYNGLFLGTDEWNTQEFLDRLGDAAENAAISVVYAPDLSVNDMSRRFLQAYHAKYGNDSEPDPAIALGFDAYIIAVDSINRICTALNGPLLCESLLLETTFPGASGNITFDIDGDPMKTVSIEGVKDGKFEKIYSMEPIFE